MNRLLTHSWLLAITSIAFVPNMCRAQDAANVGTVLKYTGGPAQTAELKETVLFLNTIETQLAAQAAKAGDINYIDRSNVGHIFGELNLSADSAFDGSSGALRGLLGRLDFLIVIDGSSGTLARARAIDLQSGAVRGVTTCKRRSFLSNPSDGDPDCVRNLLAQLEPAVRHTLTARKTRQDNQAREAHERQESERLAAILQSQKQVERDRQIGIAAEKAKQEQIAQQKASQEQAAKQQKALDDIQQQITALQPDLEGQISRLAAANSFWDRMKQELAARGQGLRSEVQTALSTANANGNRCQRFSGNGQPVELRACVSELGGRLDRLEDFK